MTDKIGDCKVFVEIKLERREMAVGFLIWDKLVLVNPGETKTFRFLIHADETAIFVNLYNKKKEVVEKIKITRDQGRTRIR